METIKALISRRSNSHLVDPIPSSDQMNLVYQAAFRAPDHSWLRPWRFIEVTGGGRNKLGNAFLNSAKKSGDVDEEKSHKILSLPLRSPMVIVVITQLTDKPNIPRIEQIQSTAAATQNILLAFHDMGYGAYWRTGKYSTENNIYIANELSLPINSEVLGYLYVGTPSKEAKEVPLLIKEEYVTIWD